MSRFLVILLSALVACVTAVSLQKRSLENVPRIIGGEEAAKGELPYQVSLKLPYTQFHYCGASVIDKYWILTAGHCVDDKEEEDIEACAGDYNTEEEEGTEQHMKIKKIYIHEDYNFLNHKENDIALLQLEEPLEFNEYVQPIALPKDYSEEGTMCTVSGWGARSDDDYRPDTPAIMHKLEMPIVSDEVCENACRLTGCVIQFQMMCAGVPEGGKDACQGDSGGPLACKNEDGEIIQAGVVSKGNGCGRPGFYGIYTEVAWYTEWIEKIMANAQ